MSKCYFKPNLLLFQDVILNTFFLINLLLFQDTERSSPESGLASSSNDLRIFVLVFVGLSKHSKQLPRLSNSLEQAISNVSYPSSSIWRGLKKSVNEKEQNCLKSLRWFTWSTKALILVVLKRRSHSNIPFSSYTNTLRGYNFGTIADFGVCTPSSSFLQHCYHRYLIYY
jgi:hypothetical protein